jgi:hypothetical protein
MSTTTTIHPSTSASRAVPSRRLQRVLASGGAVFTVVVIIQNVLRGMAAPANDAAASEVLAHYRDDTAMALVLTAMFVVSGLCIAGFVAELLRRLVRRGADPWTFVGAIGAVGVIAMFSVVVAAEAALVGAAGRADPSLATVDALWLTHNAVFAVLGLSLGTALLGLARAGVAAGLTPAFFRWLAPVGAGGLCLGAAAAPVLADGSVMAAMAPSLLGFVTWLAFLVSTSRRMVRQSA